MFYLYNNINTSLVENLQLNVILHYAMFLFVAVMGSNLICSFFADIS